MVQFKNHGVGINADFATDGRSVGNKRAPARILIFFDRRRGRSKQKEVFFSFFQRQ